MNLPKVYEPAHYEHDIYELWEASGAFLPAKTGKPFTIVMPPPNANAPLHIGHALTIALEDLMIRYQRQRGRSSLYLPGADHAGFETWVVYEKHLAKAGKTRFDYSREELFDQVWNFVAKNRGTMEKQVRALGASCDWSRFTFTLDEEVVQTTYSTFKKMWEDDLIYRGERIVNYCTQHDTSFSDIEVEYHDEKGKLWFINYPLTDGSGQIVVATTRPETMLGDTAVAVNPEDKRYSAFIGKTVKLPLTKREIPIIADRAVETEFGTGAVKVTPAHDQTDFEIASRHDLPAITVIGYDGKITAHAPEKYRELTVAEARKAVVEDLKSEGFIDKIEDYQHSVGHCYKCDTVIEPLLKEQWFVRMKPLAKLATEAIKQGKIDFFPANKRQHALRYLENIKDWNISRQIAWGIPIPAFNNVDVADEWIFSDRVAEETIEVDGRTYARDPDVFDTWFSSAQWPYVTLGYPHDEDFKKFYPTSVMETGGEIFNQWVLRMIMLGLYTTGKVPFETVYIHGYVLAEDGTKMSKSLGNVVNPVELIDQYGSDALRMGLISGRVAGTPSSYSPDKIIGARNFTNKLWNISRYTEDVLGDDFKLKKANPKTSADYWILWRLEQGAKKIADLLDNYRFSEAYEVLYHLVWNDFADWYIEASKVSADQQTLANCLTIILGLAHPFAPFVTETIWQTLAWTDGQLISQPWPKIPNSDSKKAADFIEVMAIISEIRELRTSLKLRENTLYHKGSEFIDSNAELITKLSGIRGCSQVESGRGLNLTQTKADAWLDVEHTVLEDYLNSLQGQIKLTQKQLDKLQKRLTNKQYLKQAPKQLVDESKQLAEQTKAILERLEAKQKSVDQSLHDK